jgi:hypothetical protein
MVRLRISLFLILFAVISTVTSPKLALAGGGQPPVIYLLNPSTNSVAPGATFTLTVRLDMQDGSHLPSFAKMIVTFAPDVLHVLSFNSTGALPSVVEGPVIDNNAGWAGLSVSAGADPTKVLQHSADIATITFQAMSATSSASLVRWDYCSDPNGANCPSRSSQVLSASANDQASENVLGAAFKAVVCVKTASSSCTLAAPNQVKNPSFENDANGDNRPDNWTSSSKFTRSSTITPHNGAFVGRFFATDNSGATIKQTITNLTPGTTYPFAAWVNIPAQNDTTFTFKFQVQWRRADNTTISTSTIRTFTGSTGTVWSLAATSLVAPPGTAKANIIMKATSLNGTIYVDDFRFEPK